MGLSRVECHGTTVELPHESPRSAMNTSSDATRFDGMEGSERGINDSQRHSSNPEENVMFV